MPGPSTQTQVMVCSYGEVTPPTKALGPWALLTSLICTDLYLHMHAYAHAHAHAHAYAHAHDIVHAHVRPSVICTTYMWERIWVLRQARRRRGAWAGRLLVGKGRSRDALARARGRRDVQTYRRAQVGGGQVSNGARGRAA